MDRILVISNELSSKLIIQRDKFLNHIFDLVKAMSPSIGYKTLVGPAQDVIAAFQIVHALSFISVKNYVSKEEIAILTKIVHSNVSGFNIELINKYIERYTESKKQELEEQINKFTEDIGTSVGLSILVNQVLSPLALEFLYRNWGIVAMIFNDQIVAKEMAKAVNDLHEKLE